jgi:hypothetical protein
MAFCASFVAFAHDKVRLNSKPCEFPPILLDSSAKITWHLSCYFLGQRISFSLLRRIWHEEKRLDMIKLFREILVIAMLGAVSVGAFAQRKDQDKRPPKEPVKVITNDQKNQRPPKQNTNQQPKGNRNRPD